MTDVLLSVLMLWLIIAPGPRAQSATPTGDDRAVGELVARYNAARRLGDPAAIAQYTLGHLDRVGRVREAVQRLPGVQVCGTAFDGVSMNRAVGSGRRAGRAIADEVAAILATPRSAAS